MVIRSRTGPSKAEHCKASEGAVPVFYSAAEHSLEVSSWENKSPVIFTSAHPIFEMVETICISQNNLSPSDLGHNLHPGVAIYTNMKILCYPNWHPGGCIDECKHGCKPYVYIALI